MLLLGASNAVNLTDGLDGPVSTFAVAACSGARLRDRPCGVRQYCCSCASATAELTVFCGALVASRSSSSGTLLSAETFFMGDVGSLASAASS
jgi:UDP-N-acetylmuramyl pentapeptide phosphotransferase/UDP-N-acetylglucosamine-1-phosphate transferase